MQNEGKVQGFTNYLKSNNDLTIEVIRSQEDGNMRV